MKLKAALLAVMLGLAPVSQGAVVDPADPPSSPNGENRGIGTAEAVAIIVAAGIIGAIAAGDDDDTTTTTTTTTTTSR